MIAGFTGAGISTESGVPDFRSPGSPWLKNQPIPFEAYVNSPEARREAWRRKFTMDDLYRGASPSRGHRALAALVACRQDAGRDHAEHRRPAAGRPASRRDKVIELHGNGTYATCLDCGERHELDWVRRRFEATGEAPDCRLCGGVVKSATISFGQAMPDEPMRRAQELTLACDLFLAIGSSLVVYPAAGFPLLAKKQRRRARHRQPRADGARRVRRSRHQRRDRRRARAFIAAPLDVSVTAKLPRLTQIRGIVPFGFPRFRDGVILRSRVRSGAIRCGFVICLTITSPVR